MQMKEFLTHCTAYGGDWTAMLASGLKKLFPEQYAKLPETYSFMQVIQALRAAGVDVPPTMPK